jgi:CRP/FNR family transcriptional regulator, anaerobic regulatory protein
MPAAIFFPTLFCGTPAEADELRELRRLSTQVYFGPEATIFSEGDPADFVFGISQGVVRFSKRLPDRQRQVLDFALPGDFLGAPFAERHSFAADAVSEVALSRFVRADLTEFIRSSPNIMRLTAEFAIRELDRAQGQLLLLGKGSDEQRIAKFLVNWRSRLAGVIGFSETVLLPMGQQDIADYLALGLETVSRTLKRLERKKLVRMVPKSEPITALEKTPLLTLQGPPDHENKPEAIAPEIGRLRSLASRSREV